MRASRGRVAQFGIFVLRFFLFIPFCMLAWWLILPAYGWSLGQICGILVRAVTSLPISAVSVHPEGFLNTETTLTYHFADNTQSSIDFAELTTSMAPFVALMLASGGLGVKRRALLILFGLALLTLGNGSFIGLALVFRDVIEKAPQAPVALGQFLKTLPFVLWVVLAYWSRLTELTAHLGKSDPIRPANPDTSFRPIKRAGSPYHDPSDPSDPSDPPDRSDPI